MASVEPAEDNAVHMCEECEERPATIFCPGRDGCECEDSRAEAFDGLASGVCAECALHIDREVVAEEQLREWRCSYHAYYEWDVMDAFSKFGNQDGNVWQCVTGEIVGRIVDLGYWVGHGSWGMHNGDCIVKIIRPADPGEAGEEQDMDAQGPAGVAVYPPNDAYQIGGYDDRHPYVVLPRDIVAAIEGGEYPDTPGFQRTEGYGEGVPLQGEKLVLAVCKPCPPPEEGWECGICYQGIDRADEPGTGLPSPASSASHQAHAQVLKLRCAGGHMFHAACIRSWALAKGIAAKCPLCMDVIVHPKRLPGGHVGRVAAGAVPHTAGAQTYDSAQGEGEAGQLEGALGPQGGHAATSEHAQAQGEEEEDDGEAQSQTTDVEPEVPGGALALAGAQQQRLEQRQQEGLGGVEPRQAEQGAEAVGQQLAALAL